MAEMKAGEETAKQKAAFSRTRCCGIGAYATVVGVFIVKDPKSDAPTQSAERIGGLRICSKCSGPLGNLTTRPGFFMPPDVWAGMVARTKTCGDTAYWAQQNEDGSLALYEWRDNPTILAFKQRGMDRVLREHNAALARANPTQQKNAELVKLQDHQEQLELENQKAADSWPEEAPPANDAQEPLEGENDGGELEHAPF